MAITWRSRAGARHDDGPEAHTHRATVDHPHRNVTLETIGGDLGALQRARQGSGQVDDDHTGGSLGRQSPNGLLETAR